MFLLRRGAGAGASVPMRNLAVGSTLHQSKFTIRRVLGEEGFGITYKGAYRDLWQPVAITELFPLVHSHATFVM